MTRASASCSPLAVRPTTACGEAPEWTLLPVFLIRSAGFPFEWLSRLGMPRSAALAEDVVTAEQRVEALQEGARRLLIGLRRNRGTATGANAVEDIVSVVDAQVRRRRPCAGESLARVADACAELPPWGERWNEALSSAAAAEESYRREAVAELVKTREFLHDVASDSRFQEALLLSNPNVVETGLPSYLRHYEPGRRPSKVKYFERQLYAYVQRFCGKNDTTSFFGPVDYGWFSSSCGTSFKLDRQRGAPWQRRLTRLSYWAAQALADRVAADARVEAYLVPRLRDGCAAAATGILVTQRDQAVALPAAVLSALRWVDRELSTEDIRRRVGPDAWAQLEVLRTKGLLTLELRIPTAEGDPLGWLCDWVERLPASCAARAEWAGVLETLRHYVARFAGLACGKKREELRRLESAFVLLSGCDARRHEGATYADRMLVYDEAQGDITACELGPALTHAIKVKLAPLLELAGGYSALLQAVCRRRALEVFDAMRGGGSVPYLAFVRELDRTVSVAECLSSAPVAGFLDHLCALARSRLEDGRVVRLSADDLAPLRRTVPPGTLVSPDCFVMAESAEAIAHGDFQLLVGELHHGAQVLSHFLTFSERKGDIVSALERALPPTRAGFERADLVYGRHQGKVFGLELPGLAVEVRGRSLKPPSQVIPVAELRVSREGDGLTLRAGARRLELYAGDPRVASNWIFGAPPVAAPRIRLGRHTPRVEIDGVVAQRATWELDAAECRLDGKAAPETLLRATALRVGRGLPARCFARMPSERKPFFLDLTSVISVELFAAMTRAADTVTVTELLPLEDGMWLPGGDGVRCCEWRMTLVYGGTISPGNESAWSAL